MKRIQRLDHSHLSSSIVSPAKGDGSADLANDSAANVVLPLD